MANKERNKRSARKARAQERAEREAQQQVSQAAAPAKSSVISKVASSDKPAKAEAKKNKKPGLFARIKNYIKDVSSEMHRVISPSRKELTNYSVAAFAMLVVFGVVVWLVDTGIVAVLAAFTGLRG